MLPDNTLYHVELRVATAELAKARQPDVDASITSNTQAIQAWARRAAIANAYRDKLMDRAIFPGVVCLLNAQDLAKMLAECGEYATIRISLEKPQEHANASAAAA